MDYWNFLLLNLHGVITCQAFPNLFIYPLGDWELSSICLGLKASVNNLKCKKLSRQQPVMLLAKGKACWHMLDITNAYIALLRWLLSLLICRFYCIKALKCLLLISTKFSNKLIRLQHSTCCFGQAINTSDPVPYITQGHAQCLSCILKRTFYRLWVRDSSTLYLSLTISLYRPVIAP